MPEFHSTERNGRILTITIERPEVMNALHPPANWELAQTMDEFCADPDLWVAIFTGATSGIGAAIALAFSKSGVRVAASG